jgi:flagellar protein FlaG
MFTENNSNEITTMNSSNTTGVKKVEPVQVTHSLPDSGKELPDRGKKPKVTEENIDDAVKEINEHVQVIQRELQFTVDKDSGITVIKVIDSKTKELIRQIPGEEALSVAQKISEGASLEIFNSYT